MATISPNDAIPVDRKAILFGERTGDSLLGTRRRLRLKLTISNRRFFDRRSHRPQNPTAGDGHACHILDTASLSNRDRVADILRVE
jgi:hypothetical protein